MPYIYKITNTSNQKIYIGKTLSSIEKRWKEHCNDYNKQRCEKRPLYDAMQKYGLSIFTIEIIEECSLENINEREIYWIEKLNSYKDGYNATMGGDGISYIDYDLVVEIYKKNKNQIKTAEILGIHKSSVQRILKLKNIEIVQFGQTKKPVSQYTLEGIFIQTFDSRREAANWIIENHYTDTKIDGSSTVANKISLVCRNKRKTAFSFKWKDS